MEKADSDGNLIPGTPAWMVHQIFIWVGEQGRTCFWVASELNKMKIPPPQRETWMPRTVIKIVNRRSYTGKAEYNVNGRFSNPERPFGDPAMGIKRTLIRPKPENERKKDLVLPTVTPGGDRGTRTPDLCDANAALSQLSYIPRLQQNNNIPNGC